MEAEFKNEVLVITDDENEDAVSAFQNLLDHILWDQVYGDHSSSLISTIFDSEVINELVSERTYELAEEAVSTRTVAVNGTPPVFVFYKEDYELYESEIKNWITQNKPRRLTPQ